LDTPSYFVTLILAGLKEWFSYAVTSYFWWNHRTFSGQNVAKKL